MIDFKKMDEKDFVFISKPLTEKEDKAFSEFLKIRRTNILRTKKQKKQQGNFNLTKHEPQHGVLCKRGMTLYQSAANRYCTLSGLGSRIISSAYPSFISGGRN